MSGAKQQEEQDTVVVGIVRGLEPAWESPAVPTPGQVLAGRYTVLELLGKGGMGVVLAAYDVRLDRRVALKLLSPERAGSESLQARLLREAQAMARLNHPHVVHVYDSGTLEGGRLFIAMEYVQGQTLRHWSQEPGRTWRQVLEAYLAAGRGLAAAHAVGLVHRDFKPDNVLVGEDGRVRVTDFGVARAEATQPPQELLTPLPGGAWQGDLTLPGMLVGTPRYMAPELLLGQPADVRSDLFAYCLALWEALYRQPAFAGSSLQERAEAMAKKRPTPPAASEVPAWVGRALLRGLEVDPALRPASVEELLQALQKDPRQQRRTRLRSLGLAASLGVGLAGLGAAGWAQYREHALACTRMEQRLAGVWDEAMRERVRQALVGTGLPYAPDTAERVLLGLEGYASQWVRLSTQVCEDSRQRAEQSRGLGVLQQACLERRRSQLGALSEVLGQEPDKKLLPKAIQAVQALAPLEDCVEVRVLTAAVPPPESPAVRAQAEQLQAQVDRLEALLHAGRYPQGLELAEPLLRQVQALGYAPLQARALYVVARLQRGAGDYSGAEARVRQALPLAAQGKDDVLFAYLWSKLTLLIGESQGRYQEALGLELPLGLAVERADNTLARADASLSLGTVLMNAGQLERARTSLQEALALQQKVLGPEHPQVANTLNTLANLLLDMGRFEDSLALHEQALALRQRTLGPEHPSVALSLSNTGLVLRLLGRYEQARARLEAAHSLTEKLLGPEHPNLAHTTNALANVLTLQGEAREAQALFERALAVRQKVLGPEHPEVAFSLEGLALALQQQGQYDKARRLNEQALALRQKALGPEHAMVALSLHNLALCHSEQGRAAEARALLERAQGMLLSTVGAEHPLRYEALLALGEVQVRLGELAAAERHLEQAWRWLEKQPGAQAGQLAQALLSLGELRQAQGRPAQALPLLERALELAPPALRAQVQLSLAQALWDSGPSQRERALSLAAEAQAHYRHLGNAHGLQRVSAWQAAHARP